MIRRFQKSDTGQVMQIWLSGNEEAHSFIPKGYWQSHFSMVQEQLTQAEVFVYETDKIIKGFVGMTEEYIAGIFVDRTYRSLGIGTQLLEYVKQLHDTLTLGCMRKISELLHFMSERGFR